MFGLRVEAVGTPHDINLFWESAQHTVPKKEVKHRTLIMMTMRTKTSGGKCTYLSYLYNPPKD